MNEQEQKRMALEQVLKKLQEQNQDVPMEAAPLEEMTPEKAAELAKMSKEGRSPSSSDMIPVPLEEYAPAGSYVGGKYGQQVSPDMSGMEQAPVVESKDERLAKLKALFQKK